MSRLVKQQCPRCQLRFMVVVGGARLCPFCQSSDPELQFANIVRQDAVKLPETAQGAKRE